MKIKLSCKGVESVGSYKDADEMNAIVAHAAALFGDFEWEDVIIHIEEDALKAASKPKPAPSVEPIIDAIPDKPVDEAPKVP